MHPTTPRPPGRPAWTPAGASGPWPGRPQDRHARRGYARWAVAAIVATLVCAGVTAVVKMATAPAQPGTAQPTPVTPRNGPLGTIAWPAAGVSAADISGIGVLPGPGASHPVPIASVAKVMTAYVILRDHPLGPGQQGPVIVVQPGEAAAYPAQRGDGDSLVPVTAGEQITERQALEALLLPSADNVAWILARWDAGRQAAFTARMNTVARQLGMTHTHYTDPSGLSASTTSTAADQVRLGLAAMREPVLAQIVALPSATIPVAGVVRNYNTLLGQDGITGLKTGSDTAAGGCVLLAAWQHARGHDTLVVAAAFSQPGALAAMLPNALQAGHQLIVALGRALTGQNAQHVSGKKAGKHPRTSSVMPRSAMPGRRPCPSGRRPDGPGSPLVRSLPPRCPR
jgi:D-alanyl-D-alanine carboxypeptidase (penicillin-binding protein 5/6)